MAGATAIPQSSELSGGPGFRVRTTIERPKQDVIDRYRALDVALISDLMNRLYTLRGGLHQLVPEEPVLLIGPACTVKVFPGDNLMVHAALDVAEPGDVIIIDTAGTDVNAVIGDMVANKAMHRGIAGFVVDGMVRDVEGMMECGLPVFARGVTPRGPLHRGPGELNYPISCGGVAVSPGDLVLAGPDGTVIVPRDNIEEILEAAEGKSAKEADYVEAVKRGEFSNAWVESMLATHGCRIF